MFDEKRNEKILLVEDDPRRHEKFSTWVPGVNFVWAKSAGMALGILERDRGAIYTAILLDHDLDKSAVVSSDKSKDGRDVVESIVRNVSRSTPILVHSTNREHAQTMVSRLHRAGFYVEKISMNDLTKESLTDFLEYAREVWEHPTGGIVGET